MEKKNRIHIMDNYSVFYVINDEKFAVTKVLHSASDIAVRLRR